LTTLIADLAMSLDGFVAEPNDSLSELFGWYLAVHHEVPCTGCGNDPPTAGRGDPPRRTPLDALGDGVDRQEAGSALGPESVSQISSSGTISRLLVPTSLSARFRADASCPSWAKVTSTVSKPLCRWEVAASV
jgi:hypothetical protein